MKNLLCFIFLLPFALHSQSNIRAWYAQGQVWIVWETQFPYPETYAIYKHDQPFTSTTEATIIGRPFAYEYLPGTFYVQTGNPDITYTIPLPDGSTYTLLKDEALFVETTMDNGSAYYAVTEWGNTAVVPGVNSTSSAVIFNYDPVNDPVNCHLQLTNTIPSGHVIKWYNLWLLGRQDESTGRPDYPVMANAFKNGMPAMFIVSESGTMDTTGNRRIPATHWLHGGGGTANGTLPNRFLALNISPVLGISVSHNDDFYHLVQTDTGAVGSSSRTAWFGWTRAHNPFNPSFQAAPGDTIINYTQRRILWINQWLIRNYRVDPGRVALQGYSMGSAGVSALAKAYPNLFSTVCAFNNGYRRVFEETIVAIQGTVEDNLPTNLLNRNNENIGINEVFDLNTPLSNARDYPLFRTWAGKNDQNDRMHWGPDLVEQYIKADSLGWGMQISWDERPHTYDSLYFHWIYGLSYIVQTYRDNLAYQELFSSKQSFPAFFNHRLDHKNNDPGTGIQGINMGDGDNWGTWGGFHNWDLSTLVDEPARWEVTAWLTTNAPFQHDITTDVYLTADLAIRKPQEFKPGPGIQLDWKVSDLLTNEVLQNGVITTGEDSLVILPAINVYQESAHRVRITVTPATTSVDGSKNEYHPFQLVRLAPNPSGREASLMINSNHEIKSDLLLIHNGQVIGSINTSLHQGENDISLETFSEIPPGLYFIQIRTKDSIDVVKWLKSGN